MFARGGGNAGGEIAAELCAALSFVPACLAIFSIKLAGLETAAEEGPSVFWSAAKSLTR